MNRYEYSKNFQELILSTMIQDHEIIVNINGILKPKYFSEPLMRKLGKDILDFSSEYKSTPSKSEFIEFSVTNYSRYSKDFNQTEIKKKIKKLFSRKLKNKKMIINKAIAFSQFNAMKNAITTSTDLIDSQTNRLKIKKLISTALKTGVDRRKLGLNIFSDKHLRSAERQLYGFDANRLSVGLKSLNKRLGGGLDKGELGLVISAPKGFKTGTLVNFGVGALQRGAKVLHVTLEVSATNTGLRYERRISGKSKKQLLKDDSILMEAISRFESIGAELRIKEFPQKSLTVEEFDNYISYLESEGFVPDLILLDYADILKPSSFTEKRHQLSNIYSELKGIAQSRKTRIWTASQTKASALNKEILSKSDVAECYEKIAICDTTIAICQTLKERKLHKPRARFYVVANREGEEGGMIYTTIDYSRIRIREMKKYNVPSDKKKKSKKEG